MTLLRNSSIILALFLFVGCSSTKTATDSATDTAANTAEKAETKMAEGKSDAKKAMASSSSAVGEWTWKVDSPDGVFSGDFMIAEEGGTLKGHMTSAEAPGQKLPLEDVKLVGDKLSFSFTNPDYGKMVVKGTLEGDAYNAMLNVINFGVDMPFESERKKDM